MRPQGFYLVPVCQLSQGAGAGPNKTQGAGPRVDPGLTQGGSMQGGRGLTPSQVFVKDQGACSNKYCSFLFCFNAF